MLGKRAKAATCDVFAEEDDEPVGGGVGKNNFGVLMALMVQGTVLLVACVVCRDNLLCICA